MTDGLEAIHGRHFHIENDAVRPHLRKAINCFDAVLGRVHDLDFRVRLEDLGQQPADHGRVIGNQYSNRSRHGKPG